MATRLIGTDDADPRLPDVVIAASDLATTTDVAVVDAALDAHVTASDTDIAALEARVAVLEEGGGVPIPPEGTLAVANIVHTLTSTDVTLVASNPVGTLSPSSCIHVLTSSTPTLLVEGFVELTIQAGAVSITPWVELHVGSTATVEWLDSDDDVLATGLKPTIPRPGDGIVKLHVTDGGFPAFHEVDYLNLGFDNNADTGEDAIGPAYNHPGQPVTNLEGLQLLTGMRYFMADYTPMACDLNFTGMTNIEFVECFQSDITDVVMTGCTSLIRLCLEGCQVTGLDMSTIKDNLKDLRCADNRPGELNFSADGQMSQLYHYCVRDQVVAEHLPMPQMPVMRQYWAWGTGITDIAEGFTNTGPVLSMQVLLQNNPLSADAVDTVINSLAATGAVSGYVNMEDGDYPTSAASAAHATLGSRSWGRAYPAINGGSNLDGTWTTPTHQPWVAADLTGGTVLPGSGPTVTSGVLNWNISPNYGTTLMRPGSRNAGPVFFEVSINRPGGTDGFNYWWALAVNCDAVGLGGLRVFLHWPEMVESDGRGIEYGGSDHQGSVPQGGSVLRIADDPAGWDTAGAHKVGLAAAGRRVFITFDGVKVYKIQRNMFGTDYYAGGYVGIAGGVPGTYVRTFNSWGLSEITMP